MINDAAVAADDDDVCDDKNCDISLSQGEHRVSCILRFLPGSFL